VAETRLLGAEHVAVRYRSGTGMEVESTLDRVVVDEVVGGLPVREFRWYKGRRHYSGWYWSSKTRRMVVYESRLELSVDRTTPGSLRAPDASDHCRP